MESLIEPRASLHQPLFSFPHQRKRSICKECGGAGICQHQRERSKCKECRGAIICQHQCVRSKCKECRVRTQGVGPKMTRREMTRWGLDPWPPCTGRRSRRSAKRPCSRCQHRWCPATHAALALPALATAVGVPTPPTNTHTHPHPHPHLATHVCTAAAEAPLPEGVSEEQKAESPPQTPLAVRPP